MAARKALKWAAAACSAAGVGLGAAAALGFRTAVLRRDRTEEEFERKLDRGNWNGRNEELRRNMDWFRSQEREELTITSKDGLKLCGSYLEAPNARACMLLFHGFRSRGLLDFAMVLPLFYQNGLSVLLVDQRAHGRSEGKYIGYGILERYDCQQWAWFLHAKLAGRLPIFLEGLSMGAATVMMASELPMPPSVVGVIADCGYNSAWDEMRHCIHRWYHVPAFPVLNLTNLLCRLLAKYDLRTVTSAQALANSPLPLLLIHGPGDDFVPADTSQENYAAAAGEKRMILVEGATHGISYLVEEERCRRELLAFVDQYAGQYRPA